MPSKCIARRDLLRMSAFFAATAAAPRSRAQTTTPPPPPPTIRMEWQQFKVSALYTPFLSALSSMKANRDSTSRNSWQYWVNVHRNFCPHNAAYFLSWHRGYVARLEQQMRTVMGRTDFAFPYWDYYINPQMPAEFLDAATGNPLYISGRVGTNVRNALSLAPFAPTVTNFRRGLSNAFETLIERAPHNPVHNLIGGRMSSMSSPLDPIFFLHHGNIDRLWLSWVRAGAGRVMPPRTHSYWSGSNTYATDLTMLRVHTWDTVTDLFYDYDATTMPTTLPVARRPQSGVVRVQAEASAPAQPPVVRLQRTGARRSSDTSYALGGVRGLMLDERSVSVQLPLASQHATALQTLARSGVTTVSGSAQQFRSAQIVLDNLVLTARGAQGGFFYYVYLNLPPSPDYATPKEQYLVGTLGAFEVDTGRHHGGHSMLHYPLDDRLAGLTPDQFAQLTVSLVRVDGDKPPAGQVISVGEVRVELATER